MKEQIKQELYRTLRDCIKRNKELMRGKYKDDEIVYLILSEILTGEKKGEHILKYIDLSDIDFKDQDVSGIDFTNTNANIDPQTIKNKNLSYTILSGLDFEGKSFEDVYVYGVNFTGVKNIDLDPQLIAHKSLYKCILNGIDFKGKSFEGVSIGKADFTGAKNVAINKNEIWMQKINGAILGQNVTILRNEPTEEEITEAYQKRIILGIYKKI